MYDITERMQAVLDTLDEEYWDSLVKLRDDMLNDYKKEIDTVDILYKKE
tara:strand:- start:14 stop:160 length:147 start_codon:yes stop_codon:yes gene_type:complete